MEELCPSIAEGREIHKYSCLSLRAGDETHHSRRLHRQQSSSAGRAAQAAAAGRTAVTQLRFRTDGVRSWETFSAVRSLADSY